MTDSQVLPGGNLNTVIRVGCTVRRTAHPWSHAVADLLRQVEASGSHCCPRWLGFDSEGRETLSYVEGETGFVSQMWTDTACESAGRLLREFHDAADFSRLTRSASWQFAYPDSSRHEVICHNDFAPYNLVFNAERPIALIDFDTAGPGPALRDVAMGVYWFAPLSFADDWTARSDADLRAGNHRLRLFCRGYGIAPTPTLLEMVGEWLTHMAEFPARQVAAGRTEYQRLIDEGHVHRWERERDAFAAKKACICSKLKAG